MYKKNLCVPLNLRVTSDEYLFLSDIAEHRNCSVSAVVRSIILDYRHSIVVLEKIKSLNDELGGSDNADFKTD